MNKYLSPIYIRKLQPPNYVARDEDERKLYVVAYRSPKLNLDNKRVYSILKNILVNTLVWAWIKEHKKRRM